MGLDGQASADIADPFENVRLGLYALRMKYESASVMMPLDVLRLHTLGTARVLGVEQDVGSLAVGKFADFLVVDTGRPDTGPIFDVAATLVFACSASNIERVFVGGDCLVENGRTLRVSQDDVRAQAKEKIAALRARLAAGSK